jgi:hypothetical protein
MTLAIDVVAPALSVFAAAATPAKERPKPRGGATVQGTSLAPTGLAYNASGRLYVTQWTAHRVAMARSADGSEIVAGRGGNGTVRRYCQGGAR